MVQGTTYALYAKHDIHGNAPDSGPVLFEGASLYDWENDFELVRDVETWLRSKFSDFRCIGRVSILEYLRDKVMQGEVRMVRGNQQTQTMVSSNHPGLPRRGHGRRNPLYPKAPTTVHCLLRPLTSTAGTTSLRAGQTISRMK